MKYLSSVWVYDLLRTSLNIVKVLMDVAFWTIKWMFLYY